MTASFFTKFGKVRFAPDPSKRWQALQENRGRPDGLLVVLQVRRRVGHVRRRFDAGSAQPGAFVRLARGMVDFDDAKVSTLMSIAFDIGLNHTTRCLALSAVRERFLATSGAREIVETMLGEEPSDEEKSRALANYSAMAAEASR